MDESPLVLLLEAEEEARGVRPSTTGLFTLECVVFYFFHVLCVLCLFSTRVFTVGAGMLVPYK